MHELNFGTNTYARVGIDMGTFKARRRRHRHHQTR